MTLRTATLALLGLCAVALSAQAQPEVGKSSYDQIAPVLTGQESFDKMKANDIAKKPAVMASINGGHFFTVNCSVCRSGLKLRWGSALNQSGSPCTAGIGRGKTEASSGGQRNVILASCAPMTNFVLSFRPRRA